MLNQLWCTLAKYTHAHPLHTINTYTDTHTRARSKHMDERFIKTLDRYDPPSMKGRRYVWFPFVLNACGRVHASLCMCVIAYGLILPAAAAATASASAALMPTQCCPFGGCFAWMLLTCCLVLLTLFENWNNGWSWPILFLLGANTLGSAIEKYEILVKMIS